MNLTFTPSAWDDYQWFQQHDRKLLNSSFSQILTYFRQIRWTGTVNGH